MKALSLCPKFLISLPLILLLVHGGKSELSAQPTYQTNFTSVPQQSSIPFNNNLNNKVQWLYYPSDFGNPPSGFIDKIYIKAAQSMLPVINSLNDFTIKMGASTLTSLPPGPWVTANMSTVFFAANLNIWPLPGQWMEIVLQTPFYFNNTQKFIVEASQSSYTVGFDVMQGTMSARSLYGNISSVMANPQNVLCDFGFTLTQGPVDAALEGFINIDDTICSGPQPIQVLLKNFGPSTLTNVTINWTLNNVAQTAFTFSGNLSAGLQTTVSLGTALFQAGQPAQLRAWVHNPNNLPDINNVNDTVQFNVGQVKPAPGAQLQGSSYLVCPGDTATVPVILTGTPPWTLVWNKGSGNISVPGIMTSPFQLRIAPTVALNCNLVSLSDAGGCSVNLAATFSVGLNPAPTVNLGSDRTIKLSWDITLSAGSGFTSYYWSTGGTGSSVQVSGASLGPGTHPVSVTVTNAYYCKDADTVLITVVDDTGIDDDAGDRLILPYPNPASELICIPLSDESGRVSIIEIYNLSGALIKCIQVDHPLAAYDYCTDVTMLEPGVYIVRLVRYDGSGMLLSPFLKRHL